MATDTSDVLKQCYLKIKSKNVGVWQKRWIVLRKSSSKGPYRLGKLFFNLRFYESLDLLFKFLNL